VTDTPFSFSEMTTVNGSTGTYTVTGDYDNGMAVDTLTIDAGSPTDIGGDALTLEGISFTDNGPYPGGTANANLTFDVSVAPEPNSLALLGTGLVGAAAAVRRRFAR
jgi:hypothetical protein